MEDSINSPSLYLSDISHFQLLMMKYDTRHPFKIDTFVSIKSCPITKNPFLVPIKISLIVADLKIRTVKHTPVLRSYLLRLIDL